MKSGLYVTELIASGHRRDRDYRAGVGCGSRTASSPTGREITVAGNLLEMWKRVEGVGNDLVFRDRTAAPTLLIGRMVVAGS